MQTIIGVRFKKAGKIYYFAPGNLDIKLGDRVIVETARGMECGETVIGPREESEDKIIPPLKVVHRIANESDIRRIAENKEKEKAKGNIHSDDCGCGTCSICLDAVQ